MNNNILWKLSWSFLKEQPLAMWWVSELLQKLWWQKRDSNSLRNCINCVLLDMIIHTYLSFVLCWSWIWKYIKRTVPLQPDFPGPALWIVFSSIPHSIFIKTFWHWKGWNTFTWKETRETVWFLIFLKGCHKKWFL